MRPSVATPSPIPNLQLLLPSHAWREERSSRGGNRDPRQSERRNRFQFRFRIPSLGLGRERRQENVSSGGSNTRQHRIEREHAANAVTVSDGGIEGEELGRAGGGGGAALAVVDAV